MTLDPTRRLFLAGVSATAVIGQIEMSFAATDSGDLLRHSFKQPPPAARPRIWWHWVDGNVSEEGIKLDLEWMKRIGLGGIQHFDVSFGLPPAVEKPVRYMSPEWKKAFRYAASLANELDLELEIAGSPGWSESGGPWVTPEQGMKKLVWSEMHAIAGASLADRELPRPSAVWGPFQDLRIRKLRLGSHGIEAVDDRNGDFYHDCAVVAVPAFEEAMSPATSGAVMKASNGASDFQALDDGKYEPSVALTNASVGEDAWISFEYREARTVRAVTMLIRAGGVAVPVWTRDPMRLEASDDGKTFRTIAQLQPPLESGMGSDGTPMPVTIALPLTTSRVFRLAITAAAPKAAAPSLLGDAPEPSRFYEVAEFCLHENARVDRFEIKAGFMTAPSLDGLDTPETGNAIKKADVIDLTSKLRSDGTLDWIVPAGSWTVLRLGYGLTGVPNHPAAPEANGLEMDKYNKTYVKAYFDRYFADFAQTLGDDWPHLVRGVITDSWEAGCQNWCEDMLAQFETRRGYDPRPWLPVLTGRVVESAAASDRFLWDIRRTQGDLVAEYYDQVARILKERGLVHYGESHEAGRAFVGDGMAVKRSDDIPMAAMWTQSPGVNQEQYGAEADIRESASVANIYGRRLVAAESLTAVSAPWGWCPETLKPTIDREFAMGVNRPVIHTSVHQPFVGKAPGLALGPFGQWFTRNETWAELAKPWTDYLARCSYMLQQGRTVADVVYFYGEDSNLTAIFADHAPAVPAGYNFDYVSADALISSLSVNNGQIETKGGARYCLLALDPRTTRMSLPVLHKIRDLVEAGATVVGAKPADSPSLADDPSEFHALVDALWDDGAAKSHRRKSVLSGISIHEALDKLNVRPDFDVGDAALGAEFPFIHRCAGETDIYYVSNSTAQPRTLKARFRIEGRTAELWHPDTGETTQVTSRHEKDGATVPLSFDANEAVFVVFRRSQTKPQPRITDAREKKVVAVIEGPWEVVFEPDRGAPERSTFSRLDSWSANSDAGIKYFSGAASYVKVLEVPTAWFEEKPEFLIDLGQVGNLAEVLINGKSIGICWKEPYRLSLEGTLRPGKNKLEIKVTNLWVNRLIGDLQPGAKKYTFTTFPTYRPDSPLMASGLLGPVQILQLVQ